MASDLSKLDLLAIQIDGLHIEEDLILIAAVGIDGEGTKHPLGLIELSALPVGRGHQRCGILEAVALGGQQVLERDQGPVEGQAGQSDEQVIEWGWCLESVEGRDRSVEVVVEECVQDGVRIVLAHGGWGWVSLAFYVRWIQ